MSIRNKALLFCLVLIASCGEDEKSPEKFIINGSVTENSQGIQGITIKLDDQAIATTLPDGTYNIENLKPGFYIIQPEQPGRNFLPQEASVMISDSHAASINFVRLPDTQLAHGGKIWNHFNPAVYSVKQNSATTLQLDLAQNALWFQGSQGGLVYQSVTGNFTITATINAVRKSNNAQPTNCNICLGGLMVRNPAGTGENYVHLVTGFTPNGLGYEYKNTTNSSSVYTATPDGSAKHDLRIQRSGSTFTLFQKVTTESTWQTVTSYNRTDLPATLMVGINIYTAQGGAVADLSVIYENITIE